MHFIPDPTRLAVSSEAGKRPRVLVADDEPLMREMIEIALTMHGFDVRLANDGLQLVQIALDEPVDLLLIDLMMPHLDGFEALRQLRNDTRTAHLPMLVLTAMTAQNHVLNGFEAGADDYLTKPFEIDELVARLRSLLRRAARQSTRSPLTGLPGNLLITAELQRRIDANLPFAFLYIDLDNFKAFNDTYGFARGDQVLRMLGEVVSDAIASAAAAGDFAGHIGGDDFVIISTPERLEALCRTVIATFDANIGAFYDAEDLARGYLSGTDRYGVLRHFPVVSLSIAGVTNERRRFQHYEQVAQVAAEMKRFVKTRAGSSFAVDMRAPDHTPPVRERREQSALVLLVCADSSLRRTLQRVLNETGVRVLEARGFLEAQAVLAHEPRPVVVIGEAEQGQKLADLCTQIRAVGGAPQLVVLAGDAVEADELRAFNADLCLQQPFPIQLLVDHVLGYVNASRR